MSTVRKVQRDQAAHEPRTLPFDFAQGSLRYARQVRRRRNRRYHLVAALLILGVGIGVAVVLLANWLAPLIK